MQEQQRPPIRRIIDRLGAATQQLRSVVTEFARSHPRTAVVSSAVALVIVLAAVVAVILASGGDGDGDGNSLATPTPINPDSTAATSGTPSGVATPTPDPNAWTVRLSSESDTGSSDFDGITNLTDLTFSVVGPDVDAYEVLLNNAPAEAHIAEDFAEFTLHEMEEGAFVVLVRPVDQAGGFVGRIVPATVTVDLTAPRSPTEFGLSTETDTGFDLTDNITSAQSPTVVGTFPPDSQGSTVEVFVDQVSVGASSSFPSWSADLGNLPEGEYSVVTVASDLAGNISLPSLPTVILIDRTPPELELLSPLDGSVVSGAESLAGFATDNGSDVWISYSFDGGNSVGLPGSGSQHEFDRSIDYVRVGDGERTLTVSAIDPAGNVTEVSRSFRIAIDLPLTVTDHAPANGATEVGSTFKPQVFFNQPVDPTTVDSDSFFVSSGNVRLESTVVVGDGGRFAWLFVTEPMPGSSQMSVTVLGDKVRIAGGDLLDADGDGVPGGTLTYSFSTVSLSTVAGTSISGIVVDPGPDNQPYTDDDFDPGPDGVQHTDDDLFLLPIQGAAIHLLGVEGSQVLTDSAGQFQIDPAPSGNVKIAINGMTVTSAPAGFYFPEMVMESNVAVGRANNVMSGMREVFLPRLAEGILKDVDGTRTVMIEADEMSAPDLSVADRKLLTIEVQPGSLLDESGQPVSSGRVGISTVPAELVRDMLPPGVLQHSFDITVQAPGISNFSVPAPMSFPNVFQSAPGSQLNLLSFDHTTGRLVVDGTATVSQNGKSVVTDPGTGITRPGWHGVTPPGTDARQGCDPIFPPIAGFEPPIVLGRSGSSRVIESLASGLPSLVANGLNPNRIPDTIELDPNIRVGIGTSSRDMKALTGALLMSDSGVLSLAMHNSTPFKGDCEKGAVTFELNIEGPYRDAFTGLVSSFGKSTKTTYTVTAGATAVRRVKSKKLQNAPLPSDFLYGAKINIKAYRPEKPSVIVFQDEIYVYRWVDAEDLDTSDGMMEMADTASDGKDKSIRERTAVVRMPASAMPTISVDSGSTHYSTRISNSEFTVRFDPTRPASDISGALKFTSPKNRVLETISLKGDGERLRYVFDDAEFLKTLADIANGTVVAASSNEKELINSADKRKAILDATQAAADKMILNLLGGAPGGPIGLNDGVVERLDAKTRETRVVRLELFLCPENLKRECDELGNAFNVDNNSGGKKPASRFDPTDIGRLLARRNLLSQSQMGFQLSEVMFESARGQIGIFLERYFQSARWDSSFDGFKNGKPEGLSNALAKTYWHELGHHMGLNHTVAGTTTLPIPSAARDTMAQGFDVKGERTFIATQGAARIALGLGWDLADVKSALTYYEAYVTAVRGTPGFGDAALDGTEGFDHDGGLSSLGAGALWTVAADSGIYTDIADFGILATGGADSSRTIDLKMWNIGDQPLTVSSISPDPANRPEVSVSGPSLPVTIAVGETIPLSITYSPTSSGVLSGHVSIESDGMVEEFSVTLLGGAEKIGPDAVVEVPNNNFGGLLTDAPGVTVDSFGTVRNAGGQELRVTGIEITRDDSGSFSLTGLPGTVSESSPLILAPGAEFTFGASFDPASSGLHRATMLVSTGDPDRPSILVSLVGTGLAPSSSNLDYGMDYVVVFAPDIPNSVVLRDRSDDRGNWNFFVPAEQLVAWGIFDPVSGLIALGQDITAMSGSDTQFSTPVFGASVDADLDNDGLPGDIEFAIGTSDNNVDSDGDGVDDFTAVMLGLNPLGGALPTGILSQTALSGPAEAVGIGSSVAEPDRIIAYAATGNSGFASIDITDPLSPVVLAEISLLGTSTDLAVDLANSRVFVASGTGGINVIDVGDPDRPVLVQSIPAIGNPSRLLLNEFGLFAIDGATLLAVDTEAGQVISELAVSGVVLESIDGEGDHVFVSDTNGLFLSVNVSQAFVDGTMSVTGSVAAHRVRRLTVLDGIAYLAAEGSYSTCDVSDPANMVAIAGPAGGELTNFGAELVPNGSGLGALIYSQFVGEPTLLITDISDPTLTGQFLTRFDLPANPLDATFAAGVAVIADGDAGLVMVNFLPIDADGQAPVATLSVSSPDQDLDTAGIQLIEGSAARLTVSATDDVQVRSVELLRDGIVVQSDASFPFELFPQLPVLSQADSVTFQARVTDTGGNSSLTGTVTVLLLPDLQGPRVLRLDPNDRGFLAAGDGEVEILFSEGLDPQSVNQGSFTLTGPSGTIAPENISLLDRGRRVRLSYSDLTAGIHTLAVNTAAVTDASGIPAGDTVVTSSFEVINATNSWINLASGDWSDAANWSAGRIPDATDVVVISVPGNITVLLSAFSADAQASELYIDERFEVVNSGVVVQKHGAISGSVLFGTSTTLISEGTFDLRGTMITSGGVRFRATTFENTGTLLAVEGGLGLAAGVFENRGYIRARGFTLGQNPGFRLGGEGPVFFNNHEEGVIEIIDGGQFNGFTFGSEINNLGVIRSDGGDGMFGIVTTSGTIEVVSGAFRIGANPGFVSNGGTFRIADGAVLNLQSQQMEFHGDSLFEGEGVVNGDNGMEVVAGATLTINVLAGFTFSQNRKFTGAGTVSNTGLFIWETGTIDLDTAFENHGTLQFLGVPTVQLQLDGDLDNYGTILHSDTNLLEIEDATLHNMPGGIYEFQSDGNIDSRNNNNTHFFINDGLLKKTGGTGINDIDAVFTNSQPIDVQTGAIRVRRQTSFTDTTVTVAAGAEFRISSGAHTFNGFSVSGEGAVLIGNTGSTYSVAPGTTVELATGGGIQLLQGVWSGGGSLVLLEDSTYSGGTFELTAVTNAATMIVTGSRNKTLRNTVLQNFGTISHEAPVNVVMDDATVANHPVGVIELRSNRGFDLTGSGTPNISNAGIFRKVAGSTSTVDVDFTNSGVLEAQAGRLDFTRVFVQTNGSTTLSGGNLSVGTNGIMAINGGTLSGAGTITGSVVNRAAIHVGGQNQIGVLIVTGKYTQTSAGTLFVELNGTGSGEHDQLDVRSTGAEAVTLDGTLAVQAIIGFTPVGTDVFTVLDYVNVTGNFASFSGLSIGGVSLDASANTGDYTLTAQ